MRLVWRSWWAHPVSVVGCRGSRCCDVIAGRRCGATSSRAPSSLPCSCPRAWRTASSRACRRSPACTRRWCRSSCTSCWARRGSSSWDPTRPSSPLVAAAIIPLAAGGDESARIALAGLLAILVGAIMFAGGLARFGFVTELLSMPVRLGYLMGIAVTVIVAQLPKLFGFSAGAESFIRGTARVRHRARRDERDCACARRRIARVDHRPPAGRAEVPRRLPRRRRRDGGGGRCSASPIRCPSSATSPRACRPSACRTSPSTTSRP